jgi:hypothetical protein
VDAYRTESLTELLDLWLEELLYGDGVTWAKRSCRFCHPTLSR